MFVSWGERGVNEYQQLFFQSSGLAPTRNHTLVITNLVRDGQLILDFVNITGLATHTATTTTPAFTAPSVAVSGDSPANHLQVGKIVGGVLGGVFAAVVTIIVGIIFLKRKKNHGSQKVNGFPLARK